MCTDLYVDKLLVYSNCMSSPSPVPPVSVPSPVPSVSAVPSPVPPVSAVPSPVPAVPVPSPVPSPYRTAIAANTPNTSNPAEGYSLMTPSTIAITKTTMSPSSTNSSMSVVGSVSDFIGQDHVIIVIVAIVLPIILMCVLVCKKNPRNCRTNRKVQPDTVLVSEIL
jgi:hypothetical protein